MTRTITLHGRTLLSVQLIWDRDHGPKEEGWFLRTHWATGEVEDEVIPDIQDATLDMPKAQLQSAVIAWLHDPDGMTDIDREHLRNLIDIKR